MLMILSRRVKSLKTISTWTVSDYANEEATILNKDLTDMLARGRHKLTKWATNFDEEIERKKTLTILALEWNNDTVTLKVCRRLSFEPITQWTQRKVLSVVCSVFDPLGLLVPFVIRGRIILKRTWRTRGQQWYSNISDDFIDDSHSWVSELNAGEPFDVPR